MIKDFEKRYEKLLAEAEKGPLVMLPAVESRGGYLCKAQPIVTSKEEIKCAEGAFIEHYCL